MGPKLTGRSNPSPRRDVCDCEAVTNEEPGLALREGSIYDLVKSSCLILVSRHAIRNLLGCISYSVSAFEASSASEDTEGQRPTSEVIGLALHWT